MRVEAYQPTVTLGGGGDVYEGDTATFSVSRDLPTEWSGYGAVHDPVPNTIVSYSMDGTVTAGVDYTSPPGTVQLGANAAFAEIAIPTSADGTDEGDEHLALTLTETTAYQITGSRVRIAELKDQQWPVNGVVRNRLTQSVWVWDNTGGWFELGGGQDTNGNFDYDYIYVGGNYYKVAHHTARVLYGPQGAGVRVIMGGVDAQPEGPDDWRPPAPPIP